MGNVRQLGTLWYTHSPLISQNKLYQTTYTSAQKNWVKSVLPHIWKVTKRSSSYPIRRKK